MNFVRGDVVLCWYPYADGSGGKRRPSVVILNDRDCKRLRNIVVAQITTNTRSAHESTQYPIEADSDVGRTAGLGFDSLVSCNNISTIARFKIDQVIGHLDAATMQQIDQCLKAALQLP